MPMDRPEVTFCSPKKKQTKPKKTSQAVCCGAGTASGSESNAPQHGLTVSKMLWSTLKVVRHYLKGWVLTAALSADKSIKSLATASSSVSVNPWLPLCDDLGFGF